MEGNEQESERGQCNQGQVIEAPSNSPALISSNSPSIGNVGPV